MAVLDHVSFDAPFPEDHEPDGAPPGRPLAEAIHSGLMKRGVQCDPLDESDYAYSFRASSEGTTGLLMVGHVGDEDGRQWLVFVDAGKTGGLFRRKSRDASSIVQALHDVVVEDLGVQPQWFTEQQWNEPSHGRGRPTPLQP